jgi:hypothetical protein
MHRLAAPALWFALAIACVGPAAAGTPEFLSNTPVHPDDSAERFGGPVPTIWAEHTASAGDVRVHSIAYRGATGTSGEGFFLYSWQVESLNPSTTQITDFAVDVPGRVAFDLDGDGSDETSAYCSTLCGGDASGSTPDQVFVTAGDLVDFRFALVFHSTALWMVSTHPPTTRAATVTRAFGGGDVAIDVVAPSATSAGALDNVPVTGAAYSRMAALFGLNLGASPGGDGYALDAHFYTGARTGNVGTAAEGLYLYEYWFETGGCDGTSALAHRLEIPFASLVPFDVDGDGDNETSFHRPYGNACGSASVATTAEIDGETLVFDYASGVAGGIAQVYVVSDLAPLEIQARLFVATLGSGGFRTWSTTAPEPGPWLAGAAAWLALAARRGLRGG